MKGLRWKEMKRWKKIILALLLLFILTQLPFIYRRYRLGRLRAAIQTLNAQRDTSQNGQEYADYKGVIHVHSILGGHSRGSFAEIVEAAQAANLNFVVMTEHPSRLMDTSALTLQGVSGGVLFINGNEVRTVNDDRLLLLPGDAAAASADTTATQDLLTRNKTAGRLSIIAYPQEFRSWAASDYDGIEIYNLYTNAGRINRLTTFFDGLWSYWSYPELMFVRFYERPDANLKSWDDLIAARNIKVVALAGSDAHANVGFGLGDVSGKFFIGFHLDPYERIFQLARTHVLLERGQLLNTETLLAALGSGHSYISFDLFCDATGFSYSAENGSVKRIMGDEIELRDGVRLTVNTPVKSRVVLIKDGQIIGEQDGTSRKEFPINQRGVYRIEAYLTQLGSLLTDKPWIISNPIYVR